MSLTGHWFMAAEGAFHLPDEQYFDFVASAIRDARRCVRAAIFIVSLIGPGYPGPVKELVDELLYARWRGLDTQLVIGGSLNQMIQLAGLTSARYLDQRQFPVRLHVDERGLGTHSKYVVIDGELVVCGSHNWTDNALSHNREDSVAVVSVDVATRFEHEFDRLWRRAGAAS